MNGLIRYWTEFEESHHPYLLQRSYGFTAFTYEDTINILKENVFSGSPLPAVFTLPGRCRYT